MIASPDSYPNSHAEIQVEQLVTVPLTIVPFVREVQQREVRFLFLLVCLVIRRAVLRRLVERENSIAECRGGVLVDIRSLECISANIVACKPFCWGSRVRQIVDKGRKREIRKVSIYSD